MHSPRSALRRDFAGLLRLILLPAFLMGQAAPPALHLEVKDPNGIAIEASGKLRNLNSGAEQAFQTDAQGVYNADIAPARYRVEVSRVGFATQSVSFEFQGTTPVSRTITLVLAAQATRIDVVEATPLPGTDIPLDEIPAPVQTASALDLEQKGALDLTDFVQ